MLSKSLRVEFGVEGARPGQSQPELISIYFLRDEEQLPALIHREILDGSELVPSFESFESFESSF